MRYPFVALFVEMYRVGGVGLCKSARCCIEQCGMYVGVVKTVFVRKAFDFFVNGGDSFVARVFTARRWVHGLHDKFRPW